MFCSNCGIQCSVDVNFCHSCGRNLQEERDSLSRGENENDLGNITADYFYRGYPYATIVELLKNQGIVMHLRTLKQKLGNMGLSRRGPNVGENMVRNIVAEEMSGLVRRWATRGLQKYLARTPFATSSTCTQSSCSFGKRIESRRC